MIGCTMSCSTIYGCTVPSWAMRGYAALGCSVLDCAIFGWFVLGGSGRAVRGCARAVFGCTVLACAVLGCSVLGCSALGCSAGRAWYRCGPGPHRRPATSSSTVLQFRVHASHALKCTPRGDVNVTNHPDVPLARRPQPYSPCISQRGCVSASVSFELANCAWYASPGATDAALVYVLLTDACAVCNARFCCHAVLSCCYAAVCCYWHRRCLRCLLLLLMLRALLAAAVVAAAVVAAVAAAAVAAAAFAAAAIAVCCPFVQISTENYT